MLCQVTSSLSRGCVVRRTPLLSSILKYLSSSSSLSKKYLLEKEIMIPCIFQKQWLQRCHPESNSNIKTNSVVKKEKPLPLTTNMQCICIEIFMKNFIFLNNFCCIVGWLIIVAAMCSSLLILTLVYFPFLSPVKSALYHYYYLSRVGAFSILDQ